jgi:hypothetical protein
VASLLVLGACSSDDEGTSSDDPTEEPADATTTTEADESEEDGDATTTTEAPDLPETGGGDIVGTWVIDASELFAANTANVGDTGSLSCSGPVRLEFGEDGSFAQRGEASCTAGGFTTTLTLETTGRYATDGGTITVSDLQSQSSMEVEGMTQAADDVSGFAAGQAAYEVDGDTLTITFTNPSVGTVSQTYQRG